MERDYPALAEQLGVEDTPEWREAVDSMFHPDNILKLYLFAAIKVLGKDNTMFFEIPDDLILPEDGKVAFGFNRMGNYASITILEGDTLETINNPGPGESSSESSGLREVRGGKDTPGSDVS